VRRHKDSYLDGLTMGGALMLMLAVIHDQTDLVALIGYSCLFLVAALIVFVSVRRMR
jgi:hypothetical protein